MESLHSKFSEINPENQDDYLSDLFEKLNFISTTSKEDYITLKEKELKYKINGDYIKNRKNLNKENLEEMIKWMSEIYVTGYLESETLMLSVNILNRILDLRDIDKSKLFLLGIGCLLIASKFEDIDENALTIDQLLIYSSNTYTIDEIKTVERIILKEIDFTLYIPTSLTFLDFYLEGFSDAKFYYLSKYICELSVSHYSMVKFLPSHIAISSICLARKMLNLSPLICSEIKEYMKMEINNIFDILSCIIELNKIVIKKYGTEYPIVRKYSESEYLPVSTIEPKNIIA